ncbi:hypothetical protein BOW53_07880 [Solemya pervernicosa gill symbiont]|uniref:Polysaccharide chain length determinant N-terminal domain-containing protein n=1 Tax=Solemya pervernicosa gill symbiont TaxID=642797 RepID=A0A1T2L5P1_9GAMM|nr:Wzz/FepE/Etk N-terminal domain-containing protein [Solemya pervernicosa gill symbiont]OOZ40382.1 hypothetical protein BOW53_07880 [Solemya pervernicosa gill symbiont]
MSDKEQNPEEEAVEKRAVKKEQPVYVVQAAQSHEPELDLLGLLSVFWAWKWFILLVTLLFGGGAAYYAYSLPNYYKATATLAPLDQQGSGLAALSGQLGGLAKLAGVRVKGQADPTDRIIAKIESRAFIEAFIKGEGLMPELFKAQWDEKNKSWNPPAETFLQRMKRVFNKVDLVEEPTLAMGYKRFVGGKLNISKNKKNGMINLSVVDRDPARAAQWANKLVARINKQTKDDEIREIKRHVKYLEHQLLITEVLEIKEVFFSLLTEQNKKLMLSNSKKFYAFEVIDSAIETTSPFKPKRLLIVAFGLVAGLLLSLLISFLVSVGRKKHVE